MTLLGSRGKPRADFNKRRICLASFEQNGRKHATFVYWRSTYLFNCVCALHCAGLFGSWHALIVPIYADVVAAINYVYIIPLTKQLCTFGSLLLPTGGGSGCIDRHVVFPFKMKLVHNTSDRISQKNASHLNTTITPLNWKLIGIASGENDVQECRTHCWKSHLRIGEACSRAH